MKSRLHAYSHVNSMLMQKLNFKGFIEHVFHQDAWIQIPKPKPICLWLHFIEEVFLFLDTMVGVLSAKINGLEDSFRPPIDILDPNLIPTIDKVVKLTNQFPSDIPDPEAFLAELERCETKLTIRDAVELAMKCNREKMLFPQVAKIYCLFLTSPPSVCKSKRTFSRLKLLKNYLRSTMTQKRLDNLMILFCERDTADKLSIEKVANK